MDVKSETYFHLAILASTKAVNVATPKSNQEIRYFLSTYGSFEEAFKKSGIKTPFDISEELLKAEKYMGKLNLEYKISTCNDADFPLELKNRQETTPVIYYRGNLSLLNRDRIAVVGTRTPLSEAEYSDAQQVLTRILNKNYVIVSGLAEGCDTLGHKAGLANGTIAVLGTPLNRHYPKSNEFLQDQIAKEHLLISQFPIGIDRFLYYKTEQPLNFAKRNQTTVALANKGVLVIKTADKGGTQNAIKEAVHQGIKLYVMRRNFNRENTWVDNYSWRDHELYQEAISLNEKGGQLKFEDF